MTFLCDENISKWYARLLNEFDKANEIVHIGDILGLGTADTEWIQKVGELYTNVAAVSIDSNILSNEVERMALRDCGLPFVNLRKGWGNLDYNTFSWQIVKAWPAISQAVNAAEEAMIYEVRMNLKVVSLGIVK